MGMTDRDLAIYDYIRNRIRAGETVTLRQAATACGVSDSTVYRLAKKLGYATWSDFNAQMCAYFRAQTTSPSPHRSKLEESLDLVAQLMERNRSRRILIASRGDAEVCEQYLLYRLANCGFTVMSYTRQAALSGTESAHPGLLIVFNESGMALLNCCLTCAQAGYEIAAITANADSPVARVANVSITIKDNKSALETYEPNLFAAGTIAFMERVVAASLARASAARASNPCSP